MDSTKAAYKRIEADLRGQVAGGRWPAGAMLPSRRDLAREYEVSLVTLDRAIGPLLADGILRADDRRGTFVAQAPVGAARLETPVSSGTIGIISSVARAEGQEHFILHELEQVLSQQGFSTTVLNRAEDPSHLLPLADAAQAIAAENVSGVIAVCLDIDKALMAAELSHMALGGLPLVCILAGELPLPIPHVFYDNKSGGYQAAQHLFERGRREITVVAPFQASWVTERITGVQEAAAHGYAPGGVQVLAGDSRSWQNFEDPRPLGYETARAALSAGWRPIGGVICVNDGAAFGVLDAAAEFGLEAGKDFALLGFDDEPDARSLGLTSLRPPMQGMAREAARLLLDHRQGVDTSLQVRLRAQVIPRASTR